jgi:hypothetical protein
LQAAREQLLVVFQQRFEQASRSRDAGATSRFFKLFPAIGWESEGLQAYASFVVDLVRVRAPASAKSDYQHLDHKQINDSFSQRHPPFISSLPSQPSLRV